MARWRHLSPCRSVIPRTHKVEGESQLPHVGLSLRSGCGSGQAPCLACVRRSGHFSFHRVRCRGRAQVARPGVKLLCSLSHRPFLLCENLNSQSQWVHRAHPKSDEEKSKLSLNKASRATSLPHRRGSPRPRCILDVPWREDGPSAPQEGRRKPWEVCGEYRSP